MLVIRADQVRILAGELLVDGLLRHAIQVAPAACAALSPEELRSLVRHCLDRCDHHGLTRDYDIYRYLNLMLVFGRTFDQDQPWAAAPLAFPNPLGRMDLLMDQALAHHEPAGEEEVEERDAS